MRSAGIVLCGGKSSRMGRPKAWLPFGAELLLQRVVRVLSQVVEPVVVVAAPNQDVPPLPAAVRVVRDEQEHLGPLAGLAGGLAALGDQADAAYLSSCDVPFLMPGFVGRIMDLLGDASVAMPMVDGFLHPLAGVYRKACLSVAQELVGARRLRPVFLRDALPTRIVTASQLQDVDPLLQSLRNLNTPEEYEAALRELAGSKPPPRTSPEAGKAD
jgi:molybdopterin-guanine dinucleotide biosynthesis protein A